MNSISYSRQKVTIYQFKADDRESHLPPYSRQVLFIIPMPLPNHFHCKSVTFVAFHCRKGAAAVPFHLDFNFINFSPNSPNLNFISTVWLLTYRSTLCRLWVSVVLKHGEWVEKCNLYSFTIPRWDIWGKSTGLTNAKLFADRVTGINVSCRCRW